MTLLVLPYVFNIIILIPIGLLTLLGGDIRVLGAIRG